MPVRLKNNARALLAVSISEIDPFIRVRVGKGERFPIMGANEWFPLALEDDQGNVEITRAVARAGDVLTVLRGQEGTTARAFSAGALVSLRLTAEASRAFLTGEDDPDDPDDGDQDGDADPELTAPRGLIFNGLIVNAYHDEVGRGGYFHPYSGTSEGQYVFAGACYFASKTITDYLAEVEAIPALAITGDLPNAMVGQAYEGRLQIENAVGACTVEQTGGDELPSGTVIRVDQETMEVVIEWPALVPVAPQLENPGFEDASTDGWDITQFGGSGTPTVSTERPKEGVLSGLWIGASGVGHAGGVEAVWENETSGVVVVGQSVTANAWIALKDTGSSQNRGRVRLHWYDEGGNQLPVRPQDMGTLIRGNNSSWRLSTVTATAPPGAVSVKLAVWTTANASPTSGVLIDMATWNVPENTGTNVETTLCFTIAILDRADRTASWSGCVEVQVGASDPYWGNVRALLHFDGADGSTTFTDQKGNAWTAGGDAKLYTGNYMFGGASAIFDGNSDGVYSFDNFDLGTSDFTIECWAYIASFSTNFAIFDQRIVGLSRGVLFMVLSDGSLALEMRSQSPPFIGGLVTATGAVTTGGWHHLAISRQGANYYFAVDGVVTPQVAGSADYNYQNATGAVIGWTIDNTSGYAANGLIDELRVTIGVARYTSNFAPEGPFPNS